MPLNEGAQPGTKEFSENVAAEVKAGKPQKQAVAIAYSEAKKDMSGPEFKKLTDLLDEFFKEESEEPEHKKDDSTDGESSLIDAEASPLSQLRQDLARLESSIANARSADRADIQLKIDDVKKAIAKLTNAKTDGAVLMDALSTLRGRVEVAASRKSRT